MLDNPLTLGLLIATTNSGGWPSTRCEAFERSCRWLAQETNSTHPRSAKAHPPESTLAAAGRLCAIQLLTGADGFMLGPATTDTGFIPVAEVAADISKGTSGGPISTCEMSSPPICLHWLASRATCRNIAKSPSTLQPHTSQTFSKPGSTSVGRVGIA